jgi:phospholipase/carboxylesterase
VEHYLRASIRCYYDWELPRGSRAGKRWPLLIALHGFQGNKDSMMRLARRIADGRMIVISLQGPYQFFFRLGEDQNKYNVGFGWGTNYRMEESIELHHRNVQALIDLATRKHHADPERVFLLGFSQPCSYNYRFVFTHPHKVRGVIAVCGGVPGDWSENRVYQPSSTHVLHIAATNDEWYPRQKNLEFRRQLAQRAASLDFRFYKSPHRFPRSAIPHIRRWIQQHV